MKFADGQLQDWYIFQNDKRWARIGSGMKVGGEITEFNSRIADVKELFQVNSVVFVRTHPAISRTSHS